jgi:ectoine hydroxylase-related dioxygenase (phytanoyl-CoA dioxygenase family)
MDQDCEAPMNAEQMSHQPTQDDHLDRADMLFAAGDYERALLELEQIVAPDDFLLATILNDRGLALAALGRYEEAVGCYMSAISATDAGAGLDIDARVSCEYNLAVSLACWKGLAEARERLSSVRNLVSERASGIDAATVSYMVAGLLALEGDLEPALNRLEEAFSGNPRLADAASHDRAWHRLLADHRFQSLTDDAREYVAASRTRHFRLQERETLDGRLSSDTLSAALSQFQRDGFLVLTDVIDLGLITSLLDIYMNRFRTYFDGAGSYTKEQIVGDRRLVIPVDFSDSFDEARLYANFAALPIIQRALGGDPTLNRITSVFSLPGALVQEPHREYPLLFDSPEANSVVPCYGIMMFVPLIDMNEENGSVRVWKGSCHTHSEAFGRRDYDVPHVPRGSCLLMDYRLLHGGMPNLSANIRPLVMLSYSRSWYWDQQSRLRVSEERYQLIPEDHRQLFNRARYT